jgi:hypothetical protein
MRTATSDSITHQQDLVKIVLIQFNIDKWLKLVIIKLQLNARKEINGSPIAPYN